MEKEILKHLLRYLRGQDSLASLEEWFIPATWQINQTRDRDAVAVSRRISLGLAEFLNGHWTEDELKDRFSELLLARLEPMTAAFIQASHVAVNTTIPASEGSSWYVLRPQRVTLGSSQSNTPEERVLRLHTVRSSPQIDTGRTLRRLA